MADTTAKVGRAQGRKPVTDVHKAQGFFNPQEAIWQAVRTLKRFSAADVCAQMVRAGIEGVNDTTVASYIERLQRGAYIEPVEVQLCQGVARRHIYALVNDTGREAPRIRADGSPSLQGFGTEQMWRAMKVLGDFTYRELSMASSTEMVTVSESTAKSYIGHLYEAGYLRMLPRANRNQAGRYRLLPSKNTGPRPPMVQRTKRVYDPNLKKIVWREEE